jgi:hypothetical protein
MRKCSIVVTSLVLSALIVISSFNVFAAGAVSSFGYSSVGAYSDTLLPGYKSSCRYLASESGMINSVSMYVQTANAQLRFGVYSDSSGKPSQLLAQSNLVTTGAYQWVTASLSAPVVAGQYYWLTVTSTATIKLNYDYASGASTCYAQSPSTMSTDYGSYTSYNAAKFSMYATYSVVDIPATTATPVPTSRPTATPTSTPTVYSTSNLVPFDLWGTAQKFPTSAFTYISQVDQSITHKAGVPSIRMEPVLNSDGSDRYATVNGVYTNLNKANTARECDACWITVHPGDRIVFRAWIKSDPGNGKGYYGAGTIGWDWYTANGLLNGISDPTSSTRWVAWNRDWTLVTIDMTVPNSVQAYYDGQYYTPQGIYPWIGAERLNTGLVWFSEMELFINP